jgi:hypothetical protein
LQNSKPFQNSSILRKTKFAPIFRAPPSPPPKSTISRRVDGSATQQTLSNESPYFAELRERQIVDGKHRATLGHDHTPRAHSHHTSLKNHHTPAGMNCHRTKVIFFFFHLIFSCSMTPDLASRCFHFSFDLWVVWFL